MKALSVLLSVGIVFATVLATGSQLMNVVDEVPTSAADTCEASDKTMRELRRTICASLTGGTTWWCGTVAPNATAHRDWPSQAMYLQDLLHFLAQPTTCLNTSYANDTISWLDQGMAQQSVGGSFMWTYMVFQVQYYDMPRKAGVRIESPWTLGMKCFAFALLAQKWKATSGTLLPRLTAADLQLTNFTSVYEPAMPFTLNLCQEVKNNCFVNASYNPKRAGSCPVDDVEFRAGFAFQEVRFDTKLHFPW